MQARDIDETCLWRLAKFSLNSSVVVFKNCWFRVWHLACKEYQIKFFTSLTLVIKIIKFILTYLLIHLSIFCLSHPSFLPLLSIFFS